MIRNDLKEAIERKFNVRNLSYIGTGKTSFGKKLLIFKTVNNTIAFEAEDKDNFYIYKVEKSIFLDEPFYIRKAFKTLYLHKNNNETILDTSINVKGEIFQGEAFNFDKELVILSLEG